MTEENGPFRLQSEYLKRLTAAMVAVAIAAFSLHALLAGAAGTHWVLAIVLVCVTASAGAILTLDCVGRWSHIRRLGVVTNAPKPYGFAGPAADPVSDLKRTRAKPTPKTTKS